MATIPLTKRGAEKLKEELHRLKTVERHAVIQAISEARAQGDLSENADAQHFLTLSSSDSSPRIKRKVSSWPANEAPAASSPTADDRTAIKPSF